MDKQHILNEIRRTANANKGVVLGWRRFEEVTGIRYHDWYGQFWSRWSDAVREAGFEPNQMSVAYDDGFLLRSLAQLTSRLGRAPPEGDLRLAAKTNFDFPSEGAFRRLGSKPERASRIIAYCEANPGHDDVAALWASIAVPVTSSPGEEAACDSAPSAAGYVYLLKHGSRREYKIGRTNNPIRREGEVGIQLPEKIEPIHYIETDDPSGIETYWHTRFAGKRKEGEWFALTP